MNEKEQSLLFKSTELFSISGYDAVGITEIVQTCGVTKPTLYHYFKSKSGLLKAIYTYFLTPLSEKLRPFEELPKRDLAFSLEGFLKVWKEAADTHPHFFRLLLSASYAPPESETRTLLRPYEEKLSKGLFHLFHLAAEVHGNMKDRESRYARMFLGLIHIMTLDLLDNKIPITEHEIYLRVHQFMHGILS